MFEKGEDHTDPVKKGTKVLDSRRSLGTEANHQVRSHPRVLDTIAKNELSPSRLASTIAWERGASPSASESEVIQERLKQPKQTVVDSKRRPPTPPPARIKHEVKTPEPARVLQPKAKQRASTPPPKPTAPADSVVLTPRLKRSTSQNTLTNDVRAQDAIAAKDRELQSTRPAPEYPAHIHDAGEPSITPNRIYQSSPSSGSSFVSASSAPLSSSDSPIRGRSRPVSPDPIPPRRPAQSRPLSTYSLSTTTSSAFPGRSRPTPISNLSVDSLASAMVASSLASSRFTSRPPPQSNPSKTPPRMQTPHMRQTLRKPTSKLDDEPGSRSRSKQRRRKPLGKLGGGKKHIHHEGARKRWREEITARERKRYEGVWASNRGLLLLRSPAGSPARDIPAAHSHTHTHPQTQSHTHTHAPDQSQQHLTKRQQKQLQAEKENEELVANVVARDIWARSRLPFDELAEVWDLVDRRGLGALDREEFVVGMWLIDQRLRGRKIPQKVGESVWGSARGVRIGSLRGKK